MPVRPVSVGERIKRREDPRLIPASGAEIRQRFARGQSSGFAGSLMVLARRAAPLRMPPWYSHSDVEP